MSHLPWVHLRKGVLFSAGLALHPDVSLERGSLGALQGEVVRYPPEGLDGLCGWSLGALKNFHLCPAVLGAQGRCPPAGAGPPAGGCLPGGEGGDVQLAARCWGLGSDQIMVWNRVGEEQKIQGYAIRGVSCKRVALC